MPKSMVKHPLLTKDDFEKAQCPIMVMIGEDEVIYNADEAIECAEQNIPNVHTVKIADCGHTIQYDQPESAAREIIDFIYGR